DGRRYVAGSGALTSALCLEALHRAQPEDSSGARPDGVASRIHRRVVGRVMARLETMPAEIQQSAGLVRERVLADDPAAQITLLPYLFRSALGESGRDISDDRLVELGQLSFYGWVAYTIYDDFLDDEGDPRLLSCANVAMRELVLALTREAGRTPGFGDLAWAVLDRQEAANAWEVTHCRARRQSDVLKMPAPDFGSLQVLAERSMGHALGCLALTLELGYATDSPEAHALERFFWHFLIARQLGDDAHDWKDDLQKGQINAVGALLLAGVGRRGGSVAGMYARLEREFRERGTSRVHERIFAELAQARGALTRATMIGRPEVLEAVLAPIEQATREADRQRQQMAEFLRTYRAE
ncbi:MAG TPA: hypothetical protein VLF67_00505, partial [Candidatus Saccharimonas sp.]|nr:hypothetical protein [Candidatus Saccharimonas sp.]